MNAAVELIRVQQKRQTAIQTFVFLCFIKTTGVKVFSLLTICTFIVEKRAAFTSLRLNPRVLQQYGLVHRTLDKFWHNVSGVFFFQILLKMLVHFLMISTENLDIS